MLHWPPEERSVSVGPLLLPTRRRCCCRRECIDIDPALLTRRPTLPAPPLPCCFAGTLPLGAPSAVVGVAPKASSVGAERSTQITPLQHTQDKLRKKAVALSP